MKSRFLRRAGALLLALTMACSLLTLPAAADDPAPSTPPTVTSVTLDKSTLALKVGEAETLTATLAPADAADTVAWSSSSASVASVDQNGRVTGVAVGSAIITATAGGYSASCTVTVSSIPVTSIHLDNIEMEIGETRYIRPTYTPENATTQRYSISFASGDSGAVELRDSNRAFYGAKEGTATFKITAADGHGAHTTCTVTVKSAPIDSVTLDKTAVNLQAGESLTLVATVHPDNAQNKSVTWSRPNASDPYTLQINGNRATINVKASAKPTENNGGYTIYATSDADPSKSALCLLQIVTAPPSKVGSVQITSPNTDDYRYVDPGASITLNAAASPLDAPEADRKITWRSGNPSIATVDQNGVVTGVAPGKATIYATAAGDDSIQDFREVEVSGILLSYLKRSTSGGQGTTVNLTADSVVDIYQYYDISVTATTFGNAKNKTINWESTNNTVAQVLNGRVTANYPGENVTISAAVAGTSYSASFKVKVSEDVAQAISVSMGSSPSYSFSGLLGTLNSRSQSKAGAALESVYNLKVSTENGTLYYKYVSASSPGHGVGGTESYYYQPSAQGQMALRDVTFVPSAGFSGTAVVDYNARATNGTTFTGTIRIEATATGDVSYSTDAGQPVTFSAEHFSAVCRGRNNQNIRYVTFDQPTSGRGTLYQDYSSADLFAPKVSSSTKYYVSSKPSINQVTFVPEADFVGDVSIPYHCVDSAGASYTGAVSIKIASASGTQSGNVEYSVAVNQRRALSATDFNDACQQVTGGNLNYIRFDSLPSSSAGTLYLNYVSSSNTGSRVAAGRSYYRNSTPRISSVSFVPATGYNGTVTIPYTGTNVSGTNFSGSLIFHVGTSSSGTTVHYTVPTGQWVGFSASDFNNACRSATGETLNYIRFTSLPSSSYGTLYYQYNSGSGSGTAVKTSTSYYYSNSTRLIDDLGFAAVSTSGTASFGFTGYNRQGHSFSGRVEVEVTGGTSASVTQTGVNIRYTGSSTPITFHSYDFQNACQSALGTTLASVQFNTLPGSGRLYQNYGGPTQTGAGVTSAVRYGAQELDQISYLPRAEYQGTITIPYTAYDTQGGTFSGTVELQLSNGYCYTSFSDVGSDLDWAKPSIEFLRQSGITNGYSNNTFRPRQAISRGEFTLMICRAFQFSSTGSSGFPDVPAGSTYAGAVAAARELGIVQGNNGLFQPERPITRQSAMTMISRAMEAAGRSLPAASTSILSSYRDGGQVSQFARPAVAALIQSGAVRGTSDMRINPVAPISRAEMAVILHRVLTQ